MSAKALREAAAAPHADAFRAAFPAFVAKRRGSEPAWLTVARADAFARFAERGFPTRRDEDWKSTDVRAIAETPFEGLAPAGGADAGPADAAALAERVAAVSIAPHRIVLVDGRVVPALCALDRLPAGVTLVSLAALLERDPATARERLVPANVADHAFAALNAAFFTDGAALHVAPGTVVDVPLEILHLASPRANPAASHPRLSVRIDEGAQVSLIEVHGAGSASGAAAAPTLTNAVGDVTVGANAELHHVIVQQQPSNAFHVAMTRAALAGRDARYRSVVLSCGAALARHDLHVTLAAEGAECSLDGLYLQDGARRTDHHTVIDHAVARTTSRETYKGIIEERGRGAFLGRIVVRPDAQKTSAVQENHNLLLSDQALAHSTPQLEIFADDVQCRHGSTVGQLDELPVFYLRTRCIGEAQARRLMTWAFANDIIERIRVAPLRDRWTAHWLDHVNGAAGAAREHA